MRDSLKIILIVLLSVSGCSRDSNPISSEMEDSLIITGILNASGSSNTIFTYNSYIHDSTTVIESGIRDNGSFDLHIPRPSADNLIGYIPFNNTSVINGDSSIAIDSIRIEDDNLKFVRYYIYVQFTGNRLTYGLLSNPAKIASPGDSSTTGDFYISYYYFNKPTRITGYYKWKFSSAGSYREIITEFDINTKIGWNFIRTEYESNNDNKEIYKVTDVEEIQEEWIIGAIDYFSNAVRRI